MKRKRLQDVDENMKTATTKPSVFLLSLTSLIFVGCGGGSSESNDTTVTDDTVSDETSACDNPATELSSAFLALTAAPNVTAVLSDDGCFVTIEATGKPDHTSSYWDAGNASGLYVEPEDPALFNQRRSPGDIEDYTIDFTLTVPVEPEIATTSSATPLGAIGIAISGAPIFNDSEGNGDVSAGVIQGFDRNGAHTGPQTYHYHLEPAAISYDDDQLVGIMADGFFIYGRREYETGEYPTDLDASNGHFSTTLHSSEAVYHYHISSEQYLNGENYLIFPGNFMGTPSVVN